MNDVQRLLSDRKLRLLSEAWDLRAGGLTEAELFGLAGWALAQITIWRAAERSGYEAEGVALQREVIAIAALGTLPLGRLDTIEDDAFTDGRELAWICARLSLRRFKQRSTFALARQYLATVPDPPDDYPRDVWIATVQEAADELNAAEDIERPNVAAIGRLLAHQRALRARAWLGPVLEAMDRGEPMVDTAARIRTGADIFEGA